MVDARSVCSQRRQQSKRLPTLSAAAERQPCFIDIYEGEEGVDRAAVTRCRLATRQVREVQQVFAPHIIFTRYGGTTFDTPPPFADPDSCACPSSNVAPQRSPGYCSTARNLAQHFITTDFTATPSASMMKSLFAYAPICLA